MKRAFFTATAATLALAGCGESTAVDSEAANDQVAVQNMMVDESAAGNMTNMSADTAAAMPTTGQEFADMAAASDQFEIQSSQMAGEKAQDANVKQFAAMLVKDHQKSTADLKAAGAKASPAVTPAPIMTAEQEANLTALRAASGADFDRLYMQQQVPAHEKALALLQGYAASGETQPLKEFASKTAPVVEQHLNEARAMQQ